MKKMYLALALVLCVALLAGCQKTNDRYSVDTQQGSSPTQNVNPLQPPANTTDNNLPEMDYDSGLYDPSSEEHLDFEDPSLFLEQVTPALTMRSEYAGATPVPVNPIDMPTPTMVPPLSFAYQTYEVAQLGLSFEAPVGWVRDDSIANTFILYNPDPSMDYAATLTISVTNVGSTYNQSQLKSEIQSMLNTIGATGFTHYSPSNTATRTLIGHDGVYANYSGTLASGSKVAGRVHATSFNNKLYTLHITYPQAYTETYKDGVYDKVRATIKAQ